jgi:phosphoglycerate dehydrogenase-like enzyme
MSEMRNTELPVVLSCLDLSERYLAMLAPHCRLSAVSGRNCTYEDALAEIEDVQGILSTPQVRLDERLLSRAAKLRVISVFGVGIDHVDLAAAGIRGVQVLNAGGANAPAVAELTMAFVLLLARNVLNSVHLVREGRWDRLDVAPVVPGIEGSVLGIVGFGTIGREVAVRAASFGMRVLYYDVRTGRHEGVPGEPVSFEELLRSSHFVTIHVDLNESTQHMFDAEALAQMRPDAFLINTARGPVVDQRALYEALVNGKLAGAALDVLETEPPSTAETALLSLPNAVITPHMAASTRAARRRMADAAVNNLIRGLSVNTRGSGGATGSPSRSRSK